VDTEYLISSTDYILKTTMFSFVIRFVPHDSTHRRIRTYIGDEYVSGTTITNQVSINGVATGNYVNDAVLIVTDKVIALSDRRTTGVFVTLFCKGIFGEEDEREFALGMGNSNTDVKCYNYTDIDVCWPIVPTHALTSGDGKYYLADPLIRNSSPLQLIGVGFDGLKYLLKEANLATAYTTVGDDAIIPGGDTNVLPNNSPRLSWLIENGSSWEPSEE